MFDALSSRIIQEPAMRTTLDIADDILFAAKEMAQREKKPLGQVISELARRAFVGAATPNPAGAPVAAPQVSERLATYGIHPLPKRGGIVTNELIDRLRDAEGI
jgi:hypothetical protein